MNEVAKISGLKLAIAQVDVSDPDTGPFPAFSKERFRQPNRPAVDAGQVLEDETPHLRSRTGKVRKF